MNSQNISEFVLSCDTLHATNPSEKPLKGLKCISCTDRFLSSSGKSFVRKDQPITPENKS